MCCKKILAILLVSLFACSFVAFADGYDFAEKNVSELSDITAP
jgi:hypothetical protein